MDLMPLLKTLMAVLLKTPTEVLPKTLMEDLLMKLTTTEALQPLFKTHMEDLLIKTAMEAQWPQLSLLLPLSLMEVLLKTLMVVLLKTPMEVLLKTPMEVLQLPNKTLMAVLQPQL
jgi:hypothetical protein